LPKRSSSGLEPAASAERDVAPNQKKWQARLVLGALALLAYSNSFRTGLSLDGRAIVQNDPRIREATIQNLGLIATKDYWWPTSRDRLYRPMTTASFLLNYAILGNGENPSGYHWLNFVLHLGNAWLVYSLCLLLLQRAEPALLAASLWTVHPLHTECVTNLVGRADLLAGMAILAGLLAYARITESPARPSLRAAGALFAVAVAGMFSKENSAVLLGLLVLWDLSFGKSGRQSFRRRIPAYGAVSAAALLLLAVRYRIFSGLPSPVLSWVDNPIAGSHFWTGRFTAIKVVGLDLGLLFWPVPLSSNRSYDQIRLAGWTDAGAWLALAVIALLLCTAIIRYRRDRLMFWAAGFFGLTLLPVSNLVVSIGSIMGERFLYLPAIAFAVALVALLFRVLSPKAARGILAAAILLCACRTFARNEDWRNNLTLAAHDVETAPDSYKLHDLFGRSLFEQDPKANLDQAVREAETACAMLRPLPPADRSPDALNYLGMYAGVKGDSLGGPSTPQGRAWYEKSLAALVEGEEVSRAGEAVYDREQLAHGKPLQQRWGFQDLYLNLGAAYSRLGRHAEALEAYRYGRNMNPSIADFYDGLAATHVAMGNSEAAAVALHEKISVDGPQPATISKLGQLYAAIPDGSCAILLEHGVARLNLACPRVQADMCSGWAELSEAFAEGRQAAQAHMFQLRLAQNGCPASPASHD
jgi:tetratricopeptide (TPR) repeat protein